MKDACKDMQYMIHAAAAIVLVPMILFVVIAWSCGDSNHGGPGPDTGTPTIIGTVTDADKAKITSDLNDLNRIAQTKGYAPLSLSQFTIEIVEHDPRCDAISFTVESVCAPTDESCLRYDQTEWDQDDRPGVVRLCAAGRYVPANGRVEVTVEGIRTSAIVRYEGEHQLLRYRDPALYEKTLTHQPGNGHPILGD